MRNIFILIVIIAAVIYGLYYVRNSDLPGERESPVMKDFKRACSACHTLEVALSKSKSREEWMATVERMIKKGAQVSPDQEKEIVNCLFENQFIK